MNSQDHLQNSFGSGKQDNYTSSISLSSASPHNGNNNNIIGQPHPTNTSSLISSTTFPGNHAPIPTSLNGNGNPVYGLYNSNRNLITQKFAPVGDLCTGSNTLSNYHHKSHSFGANNNNAAIGSTGNSHLNSTSYGGSGNTATNGVTSSNKTSSNGTAGGYQIKNSDPSYRQSNNSDRGDDASVKWNNTCVFNTGSTLDSIQASADSFRSKWGPTRDELKDKLANSLASDSKIAILPGFQTNYSGERLLPYAASTSAINNGKKVGDDEDKDNERLSSPVSRAQLAIGQSRRELGQVQSMMEMRNSNDKLNICGGVTRHSRAKHWVPLDSEAFVMKRSKQQSYRQDLEKQIEQSQAKKCEIRRLDMVGDHPLGVKYNTPLPHNYLEDCLWSSNKPAVPAHLNTAGVGLGKDYSKYLDMMSKRETLPDERFRQSSMPPQIQRPQGPSSIPQFQPVPVPNKIQNQFAESKASPRFDSPPQQQQPVPNMQQQQFAQQPHLQQPFFDYNPFYQAYHPYYAYPPAPDGFNQYPGAPQSAQPFQPFPNQRQGQGPNGFAQQVMIPRQQLSPEKAKQAQTQPSGSASARKVPDSSKSNEPDEDDELNENEDREQSYLRLHVWQESDQMPNVEVKSSLYKRDLMKQIGQKRREQMDRKAKEAAEDEKLERNIQDYQEKMKREVEQERFQLSKMSGIKHKKHDHDVTFHLRSHHHHRNHLEERQAATHDLDNLEPISMSNGNGNGNAGGTWLKPKQNERGDGDIGHAIKRSNSVESINSGYSENLSHLSTDTFTQPNTLPAIALPTFVHNNNNNNNNNNNSSTSARPIEAAAKQGKILQDLKVLSNVHKILKMEAKRIDRVLQDKRRRRIA